MAVTVTATMTTAAEVVATAIATMIEATAAATIVEFVMTTAEVIIPEKVLRTPQAYLTSGEQCFVLSQFKTGSADLT